MNRELGADFDLRAFRHNAVYNEAESRIEIHLESLQTQTVLLRELELSVELAACELIHTENSYKYDLTDIARLSHETGFVCERTWFDRAQRFSSNLLLAV